jgi:NADPH:quinone reductase-like Zn-dependent oxidoreductase
MRAIVLEKFGGVDSLVYADLPEPEPMAGHVVIEIKAFGINHAEMHMRIFRLEEIREAHRGMEANEAGWKMVVVHD